MQRPQDSSLQVELRPIKKLPRLGQAQPGSAEVRGLWMQSQLSSKELFPKNQRWPNPAQHKWAALVLLLWISLNTERFPPRHLLDSPVPGLLWTTHPL